MSSQIAYFVHFGETKHLPDSNYICLPVSTVKFGAMCRICSGCNCLFVLRFLRPSQPNGVMSSAVSLLNHWMHWICI